MALLGSDTSVTGPFPSGVLLIETLSGTETLGAPYVYELGLLSQDVPSVWFERKEWFDTGAKEAPAWPRVGVLQPASR
jgi:hypothetical protein